MAEDSQEVMNIVDDINETYEFLKESCSRIKIRKSEASRLVRQRFLLRDLDGISTAASPSTNGNLLHTKGKI